MNAIVLKQVIILQEWGLNVMSWRHRERGSWVRTNPLAFSTNLIYICIEKFSNKIDLEPQTSNLGTAYVRRSN